MARPRYRSRFGGWYWRSIFRLASHRASHGVLIGTLWQDPAEADQLYAKIDAALALIAERDPRRFDRIINNARGILVIGTVGGAGVWSRDSHLVRLREDYVLDPGISPTHIATTLVHEGTHAWLCRLGFGYEEHRRARIEAICYRSEVAFAGRIPNGAALIPDLEDALALDPAFYAAAAARERDATDLRTLGVPNWLVRLLMLISRRRAA